MPMNGRYRSGPDWPGPEELLDFSELRREFFQPGYNEGAETER